MDRRPMLSDLEIEPPHCVGIVGSSARAAAFSALRAGLTPFCWDLFGDLDLTAVAECQVIDDLGDESVLLSEARRGLPMMQTGGMENHVHWAARASATGPIWGNSASSLHRVRDPFQLFNELTAFRLPLPEVRPFDDPPPADDTWLLKPIAGGAGRGIRR
jgi:uncharacterized protein